MCVCVCFKGMSSDLISDVNTDWDWKCPLKNMTFFITSLQRWKEPHENLFSRVSVGSVQSRSEAHWSGCYYIQHAAQAVFSLLLTVQIFYPHAGSSNNHNLGQIPRRLICWELRYLPKSEWITQHEFGLGCSSDFAVECYKSLQIRNFKVVMLIFRILQKGTDHISLTWVSLEWSPLWKIFLLICCVHQRLKLCVRSNKENRQIDVFGDYFVCHFMIQS